jgi:hypothetical protein
MKATAFLPVILALTAAAEMQLYKFPTPLKRDLVEGNHARDLTTLTSVAAEISDALTQLDTSVKGFETDASQVQSSASNLVSVIKSGTSKIVSSSDSISLSDVMGLQDVATSLVTAGQSLITDLEAKKAAFEAAGLCASVADTITSVGTEIKGFVDGVVKKLPQDVQAGALQLTGGISDFLTKGAESFGASQCKDAASSSSAVGTATATATETTAVKDTYPTSAIAITSSDIATTSSAEAVTETGLSTAVTVTVTAPCACETSSTSTPVIITTASVPFPTGANSTGFVPPASATTSATQSIVTAGAVSSGIGAVGVMAGLAAALLL